MNDIEAGASARGIADRIRVRIVSIPQLGDKISRLGGHQPGDEIGVSRGPIDAMGRTRQRTTQKIGHSQIVKDPGHIKIDLVLLGHRVA